MEGGRSSVDRARARSTSDLQAAAPRRGGIYAAQPCAG